MMPLSLLRTSKILGSAPSQFNSRKFPFKPNQLAPLISWIWCWPIKILSPNRMHLWDSLQAKSIGSRSLPSYLSNHHLSMAPASSHRMVCTRVKHPVRQSLPPNPTQIICTARPTLSSLKPPKTLPRTST